VKRGPNEPPFQQQQQQPQQQQQGEGSGARGKRNRRGNRSGRPRAQQAQPVQQQEPPPLAPQPFQFGHIASPVFHSPRVQVAPWYPPPAPQPTYPSFTSAHNLAKRLGVIPSIKTVKHLETFEMTKDPRPLKKARRTPTDKEMVDIWGLDFEEELVPTEDTAGPSGTTQRLVTISSANDSTDDGHVIKQRITSSPPSFTTSVQKGRREQSSYLPCIFATGYNKLPSLNMGDENLTEAEWMLDSGASEHFTGDINDFVEFETLAPIAVQTATETTNIIGRGSVILQIKNKVLRIYPVYYIPELTTRLFSLGQFLQAGLLSSWNARQISVHEGEEEFLSFYPRHKKGTIYVVQSLLGKKVDSRIETIHMVNFETMHR